MRTLILVLVALTCVAAAPPGCGGKSCTMEARASVQVKVVDVSGALVETAKVTFSVDGAAESPAECLGSTAQSCQQWIAGYEVAGTFRIVAKSADGKKRAEQTVLVEKDECHVQTQQVTLQLE